MGLGGSEQETVFAKIREGFEKIVDQPETSARYGGMDKSPGTYGVVKSLRDNDVDLHTDQQVGIPGMDSFKVSRCLLGHYLFKVNNVYSFSFCVPVFRAFLFH